MVNPTISVKMLTYNHVQFIARAIESVLAQKTEYPFELVIGEDASTDGTRDIVFRYQQEFHNIIRVVTSDHNVGMKKNSYRTNKVCRGKYIAYCEGDDFWHHPSKLQKQVEYLEANPDCGIVFSSYDVHCPESGLTVQDVIKHKKWTLPEKWDVETIVAGEVGVGRAIVTCTVAARLALVNRIIEDDSYLHQNTKFLMGDIQLWAALVSRSRAHFLPESLATYVLSSESATRSKNLIKLLKFNLSSS